MEQALLPTRLVNEPQPQEHERGLQTFGMAHPPSHDKCSLPLWCQG